MISEIENLLNNKSDNLYVHTKIKSDKASGFSMNTNFEINDSELSELCTFINTLNTENVILVCRSSKEPFTEEHPPESQLNLIASQTDKNIIIFYQEPWPEPVPSFIEKNTSVIRFGYDEGCELDKKCIDSTFSIKVDVGEYIYLVNKNKSIKLNKKTNII
jgi:hypothetical protein